MKFKQIIAAAVIATFTSSVFASTSGWYDLRKVANSPNQRVNLNGKDGSVWATISTDQAQSIVQTVDKVSLLSGIYPKVYLDTDSSFNASAGYIEGAPVILLNKSMYDYLVTDKGAAAALIGHEMAHLYYRHSDSSADAKVAAAVAGFIIGLALEILFQGKLGIIGLGANIGGAVEDATKGAFKRPQESEADSQGLIWAIQAGYDPSGGSRLFKEMQRRSGGSGLAFFSTHPSPDDRFEKAQNTAAIYKKYKSLEVLTTPELLAMNKTVDEDYERLLPTSEQGKSAVMAFGAKDYAKAKSLFEICAANGEVACLNNLGVFYQFGLGGTSVDLAKAAQYYKDAADKGSGKSLHNFAVLYAKTGEGYKDLAGLMKMEKKAAEMGSPGAMGTYAVMSLGLDGFGASNQQKEKFESMLVPQKTLVNYAKTASMRGFKDGYTALGSFYLDGYGLPKNIGLAEMYLTKAANQGDLRAVAFLLIIYDQIQPDPDKAKALRTQFVKDPSTEDQISKLSGAYYCKKDNSPEKLKICFEGAKKRRYTTSGSYTYGTLLIAGMGTDKQPGEGLAWVLYSKEALKNPNAVDFYEKVTAKLPPEALAKIQERAKQIEAEAPKGK